MSRIVEFEGLHNFRDLGGYPTDDGRTVRRRRLYRSDSLAKLTASDWRRFLALGIHTVVDLRKSWEIERRGRIPVHRSFTYHNVDINHSACDQADIDSPVDISRFLAGRYMEYAVAGASGVKQALEVVAAANGPVVLHCGSGKDRTGVLAAIILVLLGVSRDDVAADFALTGLATERLIADWRNLNPNRTLRWSGYGQAPAEAISIFLSELTAEHGSVESYVLDGLGCEAATVSMLRSRFLHRTEGGLR